MEKIKKCKKCTVYSTFNCSLTAKTGTDPRWKKMQKGSARKLIRIQKRFFETLYLIRISLDLLYFD
jgi:hypothetical protein